MSNFQAFMRQNKIKKQNVKYAASSSFTDEKGEKILWEFRQVPSREVGVIREDCMKKIPVMGKPGAYRQEFNGTLFAHKLICKSCVFPDLYNVELQNDYNVATPEELLYELVENPGDYSDLVLFVQNLNGFNATLDDKVDEAKN